MLNYIDITKNAYIPKLNGYRDNGEVNLKEEEPLHIYRSPDTLKRGGIWGSCNVTNRTLYIKSFDWYKDIH
jgi:hypothetical protein